MQAVAGDVWALVGELASAALYVLRGRSATGWQRVDNVAGHFVALRSEAQGSTLLALRADPPALLLMDEGSGVLHTWPLPPAAQATGAAWFPTT